MAPWAAMPGQCSLATIARRFTRAAWLCIALALVGMGPPAAAESTTAPSEPNADWVPPIEDTSVLREVLNQLLTADKRQLNPIQLSMDPRSRDSFDSHVGGSMSE